jgi:hypothetical protein
MDFIRSIISTTQYLQQLSHKSLTQNLGFRSTSENEAMTTEKKEIMKVCDENGREYDIDNYNMCDKPDMWLII